MKAANHQRKISLVRRKRATDKLKQENKDGNAQKEKTIGESFATKSRQSSGDEEDGGVPRRHRHAEPPSDGLGA